jgi:hypothetical protein
MKKANSNPMGSKSVSSKPDAGVLRMMSAKVSGNLNNGNKIVPKQAKLKRPTADRTPSTSPMAPKPAPVPPNARLNRKPRTR